MKKILYLEDSQLDAMLVQHHLAKHLGITALQIVNNADDFKHHLETEKYTAVFCDNSVFGMDAQSAIKLVKEKQAETPVIVLSGHLRDELIAPLLEAGAFDYLDKAELWRLDFCFKRLLPETKQALEPIEVESLESTPANRNSLKYLIEVIQKLSMARSIEEIANIVRLAARRLVNADGATFVLQENKQCFYVDEDAIATLWKGKRFPMEACISGWSMIHKEQVVIPDIYQDSRVPVEAYRPTFVKSLVMTPVRRDAPIAAIGTYWSGNREAEASEKELLQMLADSTSLAMENVMLYNELEQRVADRTKQLLTLNKELESFTHAVSHDLRSPLISISKLLALMIENQEVKLTEDFKQNLEIVMSESKRLSEMVSDMLKLSKLTQSELRKQKTDLSNLVSDISKRLTANSDKSAEIKIQENLYLYSDPSLLSIALENLLSNALKYSSKVETAKIEFGEHETSRKNLRIFFIKDNGAGFEMSQSKYLFKLFSRLHAPEDFPGTGVGLATVQRVIHKHGGEVWAESHPGQGACFYFSLPDEP
ncbi:MAG: response regulator [Candidatus Obscuribacterales bacterium]|nr:response regulator [Candidatus Obscuribacterales bacterium]